MSDTAPRVLDPLDSPHWQPGSRHFELAEWPGGVWAAATIALVVLSYDATYLIGHAWSACADLDAGNWFGLAFLVWPLLFLGSGSAMLAGGWLTRRQSLVPSVMIALVLALVVLAGAIMFAVPYSGEPPATLYDPDAMAECGPGGIPTWWPTWLPS